MSLFLFDQTIRREVEQAPQLPPVAVEPRVEVRSAVGGENGAHVQRDLFVGEGEAQSDRAEYGG